MMFFWFGCGFASLFFIVMMCVVSGEKWKPETIGHLFIVVMAIFLGPISLFFAVVFMGMDIIERIDS